MSATIHPSSVILRCPKCGVPMTWVGHTAQCDSEICDDYGKMYKVELPALDVKLTPEHSHNWPNGTPRYDEHSCPQCIAERAK